MRINPWIALIFAALAAAPNAGSHQCEWSPLGRGTPGTTAGVRALTVLDRSLYAGGTFHQAGDVLAFAVARWDGSKWSALGPGLESGYVYSLAVFDHGRAGGPAVYAGGTFERSGAATVRRVARWDGAAWSEVGGGVAGGATKPDVYAFCTFDDGAGPALYAGGLFTSAGGVTGTAHIARWDGESWSALGTGMNGRVRALAVFDDGTGPALYAGGYFTTAGGVPARHIAKWDGASWSEVGGGMDNRVGRLAVYDDGTGPALYASGPFTRAGGVPAKYLAKWDGRVWSDVGGSGYGGVMTVFDDGRGPALYVGGAVGVAGETPVNCIARWDGREWEALGEGLGGKPVPGVSALAVFDDGAGPALYVGGGFFTAGGEPANHIARWRCDPPPPCPADCDASGSLDFFDFLCFSNLFGGGDPLADCDGSGGLDFFDFLCFQNEFVAGCP